VNDSGLGGGSKLAWTTLRRVDRHSRELFEACDELGDQSHRGKHDLVEKAIDSIEDLAVSRSDLDENLIGIARCSAMYNGPDQLVQLPGGGVTLGSVPGRQ
jgi:hypothetical protein